MKLFLVSFFGYGHYVAVVRAGTAAEALTLAGFVPSEEGNPEAVELPPYGPNEILWEHEDNPDSARE